jgi:hypothetical protein
MLAFHLLERPAEPGERIGRNADTAIDDGNNRAAFGPPAAYLDMALVRRKFHRV